MLKYQVFHACFEQHLSCYDTFSSHAFRVSLKTGSRDPHFGYLRLPETMICNIRTFVGTTNYRPQRSCGQGNIFAPVCHYVHRGEGVVSHKVLRQRQNPPPGQGTHPQSRPPPPDQTHTPLNQTPPPQTRHTPPLDKAHPPTRHSPPPPREADSGIRSTSGRYASYWNAFLFCKWI